LKSLFDSKQFLDGEIRGKEWKDIRSQKFLISIFDKYNIERAKTHGVGEKTIKRFLGPN
jgi:hypothetical protein